LPKLNDRTEHSRALHVSAYTVVRVIHQVDKANLDSLGPRENYPWTDLDKSWHVWLRPPRDPTCQN